MLLLGGFMQLFKPLPSLLLQHSTEFSSGLDMLSLYDFVKKILLETKNPLSAGHGSRQGSNVFNHSHR